MRDVCRPTKGKKMRPFAFASMAISVFALPLGAAAEAPNGDQVIREMAEAIEPSKPSTRVITLTAMQAGDSESVQLIQARKVFPDGKRSLTFVLQPEDARGLAYLVEQREGESQSREYVYAPTIRRVRKLSAAENYTAFLHTDFTFGDLGLLPLDAKNELLDTTEADGRKFYRVQSTPGSTAKQWYYSHYITWIDAATKLPAKREYFSPAGELFKLEIFDEVTDVDGIPTPTKITMKNLPSKSISELVVDSVSYKKSIPDEFFAPEALHRLSDAENVVAEAARTGAP